MSRRDLPTNGLFILGALATGLLPIIVFVVLSYHQTLRRAEVQLVDIVEVASKVAENAIEEAELELERFARVSEMRLTEGSKRLLEEIVYTNPYFREAGFIEADGMLVYSTAAQFREPFLVAKSFRADPGREGVHLVGRFKTKIMQEESIVVALAVPGRGEANLLIDPEVMTLAFDALDLGPSGLLLFTTSSGQVLAASGARSPPPSLDEIGDDPTRILVSRSTPDGQVIVHAELGRAWVLRDWSANLSFAIPLATVLSLLLALLMIRLRIRQRGLDRDLRLGIERDELSVAYQPIIDLENGRCVAAEALLRWQHPVHGLVPPSVFVPLAEQSGLSALLTDYTLHRVLHDQMIIGRARSDIQVMVTGSSTVLASGRLEDALQRLEVSESKASRLGFEISGHAFIEEAGQQAKEAMIRLRLLGYRFALNDFGKGPSGLAYLSGGKFEYLKVDQAFIQGTEPGGPAALIIDAVVDLAAKLGSLLVAEGIETEAQRDFVRKRGIRLGQGWLFAPSLSAEDFEAFLVGKLKSGGYPDTNAPDARSR